MTRAKMIQTHLDDYFIYGCDMEVATPEPYWWHTNPGFAELIGPTRALGWGSPIYNLNHDEDPARPPLVFCYCPEVIDEQTCTISPELLEEYLELICWIGSQHASLWSYEKDVDARHLMAIQVLSSTPEGKESVDLLEGLVMATETAQEDDGFDDIVAGLDIDVNLDDVFLPETLDDLALTKEYNRVRNILIADDQMAKANPDTREARDLHSYRDALIFEFKRRGMWK